MSLAICPAASRARIQVTVRYQIDDHITLTVSQTPFSVWVPVIPETPYQRIIEMWP